MSDPNPIHDEKTLAERLRDEARRSRPAFCEALHARIWRAIGESRQRRPAEARPEQRRTGKRSALAWAIVAAACLAAAAIVWKTRDTAPRPALPGEEAIAGRPQLASPASPGAAADEAVDFSPVTGLTGQVSAGIPGLVDAAIDAQRWAYLDHDARLTLEILADRLPFDLGSSLAASGAAKTP